MTQLDPKVYRTLRAMVHAICEDCRTAGMARRWAHPWHRRKAAEDAAAGMVFLSKPGAPTLLGAVDLNHAAIVRACRRGMEEGKR